MSDILGKPPSAPLGELPYTPAPEDPANPLQKYMGQVQQVAIMSRMLHQPPMGGMPGQLGAPIPSAPPGGMLGGAAPGGGAVPGGPGGAPGLPGGGGGGPAPAVPPLQAASPAIAPGGPAAGPAAVNPLAQASAMGGAGGAPAITQASVHPQTGRLVVRPGARGRRGALPDVPEYGQPGWMPPPTTPEQRQRLENNKIEGRPVLPEGEKFHVPTRIPSAAQQRKEGNPHEERDPDKQLIVDWKTAMAPGAQGWRDKAAATIRGYTGFKPKEGESSEETIERFRRHVRDNLLHIHDSVPEEWRGRASAWYEGANRLAQKWAKEYGLTPHQIAGALAAQSPQRDWFQNVSLVDRMLRIAKTHGNQELSPEAEAVLKRYADNAKKPGVKAMNTALYEAVRGKTLGQLTDPAHRGAWIHAHDMAHGDPSYREVRPEGGFGEVVLNKGDEEEGGKVGAPRRRAWGSLNNTIKAQRMLQNPDLEHISRNVGDVHKVRNFYNNIIAPNSKRGDVTIDTHAIAAGLLRPLGQSAPEVEAGMAGTPSNDTLGINGLYHIYAEAYRDAAKARGILPRQMQSITWEGLRGIFSPEAKRNEKLETQVNDLWKKHAEGKLSGKATRQQIIDLATPNGHPRAPAWHRPELG